ncbi:transmembrane protein 65 isoform X3 [Toxorhynchites rutilus septentrionalis]|uniref:transmembrane protein 65 isoform X3 n=1 Tax=Toxorhynchites rutilus septentrionalis TaxID=329112 RepID=UPI00247AB8BF|nr:transmembrane protein 65 isoform X3 [Toxorhynchites rutilus septentrionalis]
MSVSISSLSRVSTLALCQCASSAAGTVIPVTSTAVSIKGFHGYSRSLPRKNLYTAKHRKNTSTSRSSCGSSYDIFNATNSSLSVISSRMSSAQRWYTQAASTLTREQLHDLVYRLNEDERELLMNTLKQFESNKQKAQFEADTVPAPPTADLMKLGLINSLPFIGFGFLDNFTMIIAGDYIEHTLGLFMCISTMAAAALGNTISDVIGIGSAFYVEKLAEMIGVRPPKMTPLQLELKTSRRAANMGRVVGITIGCLLGMCPLLFRDDEEDDAKKEKNAAVNVEKAKLEEKGDK